MDELPELPFERVLSYLSFKDLLKSRAVSRGWYQRVDNYKVKSLCYSERPRDFIYGKNRWINGAFTQNFISSTKFDLFFNTYGQSILSHLKHLRLCELDLGEVNCTAFSLAQALNSFDQLEDLGLFYFNMRSASPDQAMEIELNLPMLTSIQLESAHGIKKLALDAPRLQQVRLYHCSGLSLVIVHGESVERLLTEELSWTAVKNLKNLKYLTTGPYQIDLTLLSSLVQLKEIHLNCLSEDVKTLFEQKQRYDRADLKTYSCGLLLNGPNDPAIDSLSPYFDKETLFLLAQNASRLADEIPFREYLKYSEIEGVDPEIAMELMRRSTDLSCIIVDQPVVDIERFLHLLKSFDNIKNLQFSRAQQQDLFDWLPEHSAVQFLVIRGSSPDLRFLSRMKHIVQLNVSCSIDAELIRKVFELPFLWDFRFKFNNREHTIATRNSGWIHPKLFKVSSAPGWKYTHLPDLETVIQLITGDSNTGLLRRSPRLAANRFKPTKRR